MKLYDLHQDLMTHIRFREQLGQSHQTSFADIAVSPIDLVIVTAFPFPPDDDQLHPSAPDLITEELHLYRDFLDTNEDWQLVTGTDDLASTKQKIILHLEGLNVFDGSPAAWQQLDQWRAMGVRSIGTHWNISNQLGGGTLDPDVRLTELGREVIRYLEQHNMIFDLAHMGRASFTDASKVTSRPLYVSHGNADTVCPHVRNYTDQQLQQIAETDGVIGVFLAQTFVTGKNTTAQVADVVRHIDYIRDLIGVRHIAVGSDLGGIVTGGVRGLESVLDITTLSQTLLASGYSEDEVEAICWQNADRVLKVHLGG